MSTEHRQILKMLAKGKINVAEAGQLLAAIGHSEAEKPARKGDDATASEQARKPKYLRVVVQSGGDVEDGKGENVNIRIPLVLLRAGLNLASIIPPVAQSKVTAALADKGINLNVAELTPEVVEQFVEGIGDLSVDVQDQDETVRVFCE